MEHVKEGGCGGDDGDGCAKRQSRDITFPTIELDVILTSWATHEHGER